MQIKYLGSTGVRVSALCMGTMTFGREADKAESAAMFKLCRDSGINFFDCANIYAGGESERILGDLIASCRDEVFISSKVYFPTGDDPNARGLSRRHIMQAAEASLKRLKTGWMDLYFLHRFDAHTPIEETLEALDDLARQGKILYAGASNFAAWQIEKALGLSDRKGWTRFQCIQPMYNLVKRQAEVELLPMAAAENLGVVTYSPLGGGLLTGKYAGRASRASRLSHDRMYQARYGEPWMHTAARRFAALARKHGLDPAALAVAWVARHPAVTAPLIGARNREQLKASLKALKVRMTDDLYRRISELSPTPPPATDRTEERAGIGH
jgi:aryl-alcohol dehydrogenase-like predicted oxidoreductase